MVSHRVVLVKVVEQELAVEVYADDAREAERLALELVPDEGREWTTVNRNVSAQAEE